MRLQVFNPAEAVQAADEMEFRRLSTVDGGEAGVFWSEAGGPSPWEMHPDCDEILHLLEGQVEIEVLPQDGGAGKRAVFKAGEYLVVPRGCWHRQTLLSKATELYVTPGQTLHSNAQDPRSDAQQASIDSPASS